MKNAAEAAVGVQGPAHTAASCICSTVRRHDGGPALLRLCRLRATVPGKFTLYRTRRRAQQWQHQLPRSADILTLRWNLNAPACPRAQHGIKAASLLTHARVRGCGAYSALAALVPSSRRAALLSPGLWAARGCAQVVLGPKPAAQGEASTDCWTAPPPAGRTDRTGQWMLGRNPVYEEEATMT